MHLLVVATDGLESWLEPWLQELGFEPERVNDTRSALARLGQAQAPSLVLSLLESEQARAFCGSVRALAAQPYVYHLAATSASSQGRFELLLEGADDVLEAPPEKLELQGRLEVARRILSVQAALLEERKKFQLESVTDFLTGLWNRAGILSALERELSRALRQDSSLGIVMCDVDYFKSINDQFGHMVGDEVLREVSRRMKASVRPYDSLGRYGGEEFLLLFPGCDGPRARMLAERIRLKVGAEPIQVGSRHLPVSLSLGVSTDVSGGRRTGVEHLELADQALYQAKAAGRNRIVEVVTSDGSD